MDEHAALVRSLLEPALERARAGSETVPLTAGDALGRVTAVAVHSPVDLPLFRNSQMDGFAVVAADLAELPATLPIVGEIAAAPGTPDALLAGTTVRIMTGAVVPEGADAVVPVEDTTVTATTDPATGAVTETVTITRGRAIGEYVRDRGSDVRAGTQLLPAGIRLAARHLAVLTAAGLDRVEVRPRVRVAVLTTGSELVTRRDDVFVPRMGEIFDANSIAIQAAVRECGAVTAFAGLVEDNNAEGMIGFLDRATAEADVVITSGGISKGRHEVVRETLAPFGAQIGHIAMQPGGPQTTAVYRGVPVISFPGNPVSTQISFEVFVAPLLREVAVLPAASITTRPLAADLVSVPGKRQFLRGRIEDNGSVSLVSGPGSHLIAGLAQADVLVDVPTDTLTMNEGDLVETWLL